MNGPQITVVGHLAWAPKARTVAGGIVVADLRIATTPRRLDKSTGQWTDLETLWFDVTCWRALAENAAASLEKGDRVVVTGRLLTKSWVNAQGEHRSGLEIDATSVGFDLSRGPVTPRRAERSSATDVDAAWTTPQTDADPFEGEITPAATEPAAA